MRFATRFALPVATRFALPFAMRFVLPFAVLAAALPALAPAAHATAASTPTGGASAPVSRVDGVPCVGANDLARLLDGAKFWRADVRKLVIRTRDHRLTFTTDVPIVILDDRTLRLDAPVRSLRGELQISVSIVPQLPRDSTSVRLQYDEAASRVRATPPGGWVGGPVVSVTDEITRVVLTAERAVDAGVVGRSRRHFRIRVPGAFAGGLPGSFPEGSLVRAVHRLPGTDGVTLEMDVSSEAAGFRSFAAAGRWTLEFSRSSGLERFAAEGPPGPRALRVVVLDPGHGGDETGVTVEGAVEKDLALGLARQLAGDLERRGVRVVLTRNDDRALSQEERAEIANRARADVVLSLHFDGLPGSEAHGATAWCPPAVFAEPVEDARAAALAPVTLTPWRDVALRHAVESRALGEAVTASLEQHGLGPARVRERLTRALLGVNAPGLSLECATLTSLADRARVSAPEGLRDLASAIAEGLFAYQRHE
jgi:N-acetylmuramoyl-L-alanine amidase